MFLRVKAKSPILVYNKCLIEEESTWKGKSVIAKDLPMSMLLPDLGDSVPFSYTVNNEVLILQVLDLSFIMEIGEGSIQDKGNFLLISALNGTF